MIRPGTALLSTYHKDERLRALAANLVSLGWKLLASAGTKGFLDAYGILSTDIGDLVGPPVLDHRVVTLDRKICTAILAQLDSPGDLAELKRIGVEPIELVYVDLYPLAKELENPTCTFHSVVEKTDIGGRTLLSAAAKGHRFVLSDPDQFEPVITFLRSPPDPGQPVGLIAGNKFMSQLAADAEAKVTAHALLSSAFYQSVVDNDFPYKWHKSS